MWCVSERSARRPAAHASFPFPLALHSSRAKPPSLAPLAKAYACLFPVLLAQVIASLTGSLLAGMLFIPGICMLVGGFKYKEQHFNWRSAGVGTSLLFVSVAGAFSPSIFNNIFASHSLECDVRSAGRIPVLHPLFGPANSQLAPAHARPPPSSAKTDMPWRRGRLRPPQCDPGWL